MHPFTLEHLAQQSSLLAAVDDPRLATLYSMLNSTKHFLDAPVVVVEVVVVVDPVEVVEDVDAAVGQVKTGAVVVVVGVVVDGAVTGVAVTVEIVGVTVTHLVPETPEMKTNSS